MSPLVAGAAALAERIKINQLTRERRGGRDVWIKRRRWTAPPVLAAANLFFRLARARLRAITDLPRWQSWEVEWFCKLHGDSFRAWPEGARGVAAEVIPGYPLADELDRGRLTPRQAAAVGCELRRAHGLHCAAFGGAWSHGDPHTGNFLYDPDEDRARIIDFEVVHELSLSADARHTDDVLIFLQDVVGRIGTAQWLPVACAFLDGYDREEIIAGLPAEFDLPRGISGLWWTIRTSYLPPAEIVRRLDRLRSAIATRRALAAA